jgi:hypothetical protein
MTARDCSRSQVISIGSVEFRDGEDAATEGAGDYRQGFGAAAFAIPPAKRRNALLSVLIRNFSPGIYDAAAAMRRRQ